MGAVGTGSLLCPLGDSQCAICQRRDIQLCGMASYSDSALLKFMSEPDLVLLEDQSSEKSGERHNKTA